MPLRQLRGDGAWPRACAVRQSLLARVIVADALGTHEAGARPGIVLAGRWAHVYRRFEEAMPDHPAAERALAWIGALYEIDRTAGDADSLRAELRRTQAPSILDELEAWLWTHNNATERSLRGPVVGRENHDGSKSRSGTEVASRLYTILETCKLLDVDPAAYLHAAVIAADRGELVLPWSFTNAAT